MPKNTKSMLCMSLYLLLLTFMAVACGGCASGGKDTLNISAAGSLAEALTEINTLYQEENCGLEIRANFAASGDLQVQIENGAPADLFISASKAQMDNLQEQGLILADTRLDLLKNRLVLIVPVDSDTAPGSFAGLAEESVTLIAMGDPRFVPAGTYALETFDFFDLDWRALENKMIMGSNVQQVLNYVESKNADAGIVFATDAGRSDKVKVAAVAPHTVNEGIVYPAAVVAAGKNRAAAVGYLAYLLGEEASVVFEKHGFIPGDNLHPHIP